MSKKPEVRYFPIPKNLKEMNSDELNAYSTQLADHLLQQARDEKEALEQLRLKRVFSRTLRAIALLLGAFFYFVSVLQIQDSFPGYGFVSIGIGSLCMAAALSGRLVKFIRKGSGSK